jgi:AraC-like DNA-binding protein
MRTLTNHLLLEDIAAQINLSVSSLKRLFEQAAHQTANDLILKIVNAEYNHYEWL